MQIVLVDTAYLMDPSNRPVVELPDTPRSGDFIDYDGTMWKVRAVTWNMAGYEGAAWVEVEAVSG